MLAGPTSLDMSLPCIGSSILPHVNDGPDDDRPDEVEEPVGESLAEVVSCSDKGCADEPLLFAIAAKQGLSYVRPSLASEGLQSQVLYQARTASAEDGYG